MSKKQIYSFELYDWIKEQLPKEIIQAMYDTGWNAFGIYELVKEGRSLQQKGNLTSRPSRAAECCACQDGGLFDFGNSNICINCGGTIPPPA